MTLHPKLSQALCVAGLGGPGLASQPWKGLWCNPGEVNRKSCPKGRFFAFVECQHSMGAEALRQSHRRRSPPPPFAQGRLLCPGSYNRLWFCCSARQRSMGPASRWVRCPDGQNSLCPGSYNRPSFDCRARQRNMPAEALRLTGGEGRG